MPDRVRGQSTKSRMTRSTNRKLVFVCSGSERQKPSFRFEWVRRAKLSGAFQVATDTVENDFVRLGVASLSKAHTSDRAPTASVPIAHGCNCPPCTSSPSFLCSTRRVQSGTAIKACLGLQARHLAARGSTINSQLIRRTTRTFGLIRQLAVSALQRRIPRSPHRHMAWVASSPRGTRAAWPRWVQPMRFAGAGCPRRCQRRAFPP